MNVVPLKACKWCRRPMSNVAEIAPFGGGPGLVAFMCSYCGTTDSVLTCERHPSPTTQPLRIAFTCPRKLDNQLRDCVAGIRGDGIIVVVPQRYSPST
jgi:hypothetical protein